MIVWHEALPSTMDAAHALAAEGAVHGTAVAAREQTAARGRRGRAWSSPRGGLWLSVVCRPGAASERGTLGLRVGLAVADLLEPLIRPRTVQIKWPNDLLVDGRKLGGILAESRWTDTRVESLVVGIGVNVGNPLPIGVQSGATRLTDLAETLPTLEDLADSLRAAIAGAAAVSGDLTEDERTRFGQRDALRGRSITHPRPGVAAGISPAGELLVRDEQGETHRVAGGEVVSLG